jgi:hypothetical protein
LARKVAAKGVQMLNASNATLQIPIIKTASAPGSYSSQNRFCVRMMPLPLFVFISRSGRRTGSNGRIDELLVSPISHTHMNRTERLFALMDCLRRHRRPVTAASLADELAVSLRTIYRVSSASGRRSTARPGWVTCCGRASSCRH